MKISLSMVARLPQKTDYAKKLTRASRLRTTSVVAISWLYTFKHQFTEAHHSQKHKPTSWPLLPAPWSSRNTYWAVQDMEVARQWELPKKTIKRTRNIAYEMGRTPLASGSLWGGDEKDIENNLVVCNWTRTYYKPVPCLHFLDLWPIEYISN